MPRLFYSPINKRSQLLQQPGRLSRNRRISKACVCVCVCVCVKREDVEVGCCGGWTSSCRSLVTYAGTLHPAIVSASTLKPVNCASVRLRRGADLRISPVVAVCRTVHVWSVADGVYPCRIPTHILLGLCVPLLSLELLAARSSCLRVATASR